MVLGSRKRRSLSEDSTGNVSKKTKTSGNSKEGSHKAISGGGFKDGEGNEHWEVNFLPWGCLACSLGQYAYRTNNFFANETG